MLNTGQYDTQRYYRTMNRADVAIGCFPGGRHALNSIWARRFIGVLDRDNGDGTIRVQIYGPAEDLKRSVFRRGPGK